MLCVACRTDNRWCPDCVDALAENPIPVSTGFTGQLTSAYAEALLANKPGGPAMTTFPLGKLYRDWLSVRDGDQSAYPSDETLAKYQQWAEELIAGGKREAQGADFRQFARLRQGNRHMDLMSVGAALNMETDCKAPEGWEFLNEPEQLQKSGPGGPIDAMTGKWDGDVRVAKESATGSLSIIYLESGDIWWHGDTKHFLHYGESQFKAAWDWLVQQTEGKQMSTIRMIHKDFDGGFSIVRHSEMSEGDLLSSQMNSTYCDPPLPLSWEMPGEHIAAMIRNKLQEAYRQLNVDSITVFYTELIDAFWELMYKDPLFGCVQHATVRRGLWNSRKWVEGLDLDVTKRQRYTYIAPACRRLAKKFFNDRIGLLQALGEAKGVKRRNTILSQLEDKGWLPKEYNRTVVR